MDTVKIVAVGDIFLGEHPYTLGHGVATICKKEGPDFLFERAKKYTQLGDIVCGNLEGIISERTGSERGVEALTFWGDPGCARAMKSAGFNCLFLANNHTAQHGADALDRTCRLLEENSIKWTGYFSGSTGECAPAIFEKNGVKVGFLAYCDTQQYHLESRILPLIDRERIKYDLIQLKHLCDVMVVSLHWGDEFIDYPSPDQMGIAHEIIDAGAQLIFGHHSHSIQGVEHYKGGLIFYSLGTFVKDLWRKELRESIVVVCEVSKQGVASYECVPIYINDSYQPDEYKGAPGALLLERFNLLSEKIKSNLLVQADELRVKYQNEVDRLARNDKVDVLKYYLRNLLRYNSALLLKNAMLIVRRRLRGRNI